jgi:hypothetical protein
LRLIEPTVARGKCLDRVIHFKTHFFPSFLIASRAFSLRRRSWMPLGERPIPIDKSRCHSLVVIPPLAKGLRMSSSEYFCSATPAFLRATGELVEKTSYSPFHRQPAASQSADGAGFPARCSTQRAGIASPHAAGDGWSGVTSDREAFAFISVPAGFVGGVPVTRAMIPW